MTVTFEEIELAHRRIEPYVHRSPILTSRFFDELANANVYFKCENLQKTGSFKIRGATNAILSLTDAEARGGVATHSSGNHGAALAQAAKWQDISCTVVVPRNAPAVKLDAMRHYGARIIECDPTLSAREDTLRSFLESQRTVFVPPYNDGRIIAGQGTAAKELCENIRDLDVVLVPIGGGGLASGTALSVRRLCPSASVLAVEPESADDAARSFRGGRLVTSGRGETIADGLRTSLGSVTWPLIRDYMTDVMTVSEASICLATRTIWERLKIVIEPSAAVPVAALMSGRVDTRGKNVGIILSGGNVDFTDLVWLQKASGRIGRLQAPSQ